MTPTQVYDRIVNQFGESAGDFFSSAELYAIISEGERVVNKEVECYETTDTSTTTVASTQEYAKPSDLIILDQVRWYGVKLKKFTKVDQDSFDETTRGSSLTEGSPTHYYEWGSSVYLYPVPDSARTLEFRYIGEPSAVNGGSSAFSIPLMFHEMIVDYGLMFLYAKDQNDGQAQWHQNRFDLGMLKAKMEWQRRYGRDRHFVVQQEEVLQTLEDGIV